MERMDMQSRSQYLKVLRESYLKARTKKEKPQILHEYCRNTGQARKYVIRKIQPGVELSPKPRKKRKQTYDGQVTAALAKVWEVEVNPGERDKTVKDLRSRGLDFEEVGGKIHVFHVEADEMTRGLVNFAERVRRRPATLEDVFFRLTGRSLVERDSSPGVLLECGNVIKMFS